VDISKTSCIHICPSSNCSPSRQAEHFQNKLHSHLPLFKSLSLSPSWAFATFALHAQGMLVFGLRTWVSRLATSFGTGCYSQILNR
jgi:hypothetical protein